MTMARDSEAGTGIAPRPRIGGRLSLRPGNRVRDEGRPRDLPASRSDPR